MEHTLFVDSVGKLPEKTPVCFKRLSSLTVWDVSTGLFRATYTEISHILSHVKISHVKSICGIGTLHM